LRLREERGVISILVNAVDKRKESRKPDGADKTTRREAEF